MPGNAFHACLRQLSSPPLFAVDRFPKCSEMQNPGAEIVPQTTPALGNTHSNTFLSFYFAACDVNTTHSTVLPLSHKTFY